ncbi:hypothetical protein MIND_01380000 [Mycena indigotica]|uniref:Uncharacterized protein n=1 Tax=Mycena indigotica TaxID=2126181 RepID=A0A8H6RXM1_9AGAR|nr:uncharacterized protein MIND_01380000 [Mycena indigotica]KAF7289189.1 hypothetical protein MIND_01380000 [Mycena indigotica]
MQQGRLRSEASSWRSSRAKLIFPAGSAIYLFGIDIFNPANITFTLDGKEAGFHYYEGTDAYRYNAPFYSASGLSTTTDHTLGWTLRAGKQNSLAALIDYAVVTIERRF